MTSYRCYFLDEDDHIRAVESIDAEALSDAIATALTILKQRPHHSGIELWCGAKRVYPAATAPAA